MKIKPIYIEPKVYVKKDYIIITGIIGHYELITFPRGSSLHPLDEIIFHLN